MRGRLKKQIWIVPLVIAGVVALFGWWGNARLRQIVEDQLKAKLSSTLNANVTALDIWTTNQTRLATGLAEEPELRALAIRILDRSIQERPDRRSPLDPDVEQLNNYLGSRLGNRGYDLAQLVNTNFTVVATTSAREFSGRGPRRPPWNLPLTNTAAPGLEPDGVDRADDARPRRGFPGGRVMGGRPVAEAHTNQFAKLFATGQPILITPFKPETSRGRGGWRGPRRATDRPPPGGRGPWTQSTNDFQRRRGDLTLMQVAAPIRDGADVRGALALIINPTNEFSRMISVERTGESGETYAFDQTGLLISQSRFDAQLRQIGLLDPTNDSSALNLRLHDPGGDLTQGFKASPTNGAARPLTSIVSKAVAGEDGMDLNASRDYRGRPVVAAWRWLPELGFGVATQIDADEAYRPLHVVRLIFVILFLLLVLCSTGMFLFSYANITWQRRLTEAQWKLKQLGQYTLEEKIGEGGMGTVYRARHALLRRDTAVKLLSHDTADAVAIERFEREVQLTCQLTHPNTIQVYDYGHTPEGVFYYAMEYLRGLNLHELVARFGVQPEARVVHILVQVCESLAEAHSLGLVHRDIKPANVFLCNRGGIPDSVKVLDFGLVREYKVQDKKALHLTGEGGFVGTPWFMPPEAFKHASQSDPRGDIYSVGALAFYLLTGQFVFDGQTMMEIYEKQLTTEPVLPSARTSNSISPELEQIILRCVNRDPNARPASALELRDLLLKTPHADEFTFEARREWWASYQQLATAGDSTAASSPAANTVKIDFASRIAPDQSSPASLPDQPASG